MHGGAVEAGHDPSAQLGCQVGGQEFEPRPGEQQNPITTESADFVADGPEVPLPNIDPDGQPGVGEVCHQV